MSETCDSNKENQQLFDKYLSAKSRDRREKISTEVIKICEQCPYRLSCGDRVEDISDEPLKLQAERYGLNDISYFTKLRDGRKEEYDFDTWSDDEIIGYIVQNRKRVASIITLKVNYGIRDTGRCENIISRLQKVRKR